MKKKSNERKRWLEEDAYQYASGDLPYKMTNDYFFRAMLQKNNKVLKGLTCSLKHLRPEEVKSVTIVNPIELGDAIDEKSFVLDIKILLNDDTIINYEMQVLNLKNWPERSLVYLCRAFNQLHQGEDYIKIKPVTHIGFLDFTLFPDSPEFYATYRLMNEKNYRIYTDKFTLSVVDLTQIGLATEEDKKWKIDLWAALFKATTWEELKMIAKKDEIFEEAVETYGRLSQDERVRETYLAREDYKRTMNTIKKENEMALQEMEKAFREKESIEKEKESIEKEKESIEKEKEQLSAELKRKDEEIARLKERLEKMMLID